MKKFVLTVTLNPSVDKIIRNGKRGVRISRSAGGKGINAARALCKLGLKSVATGILGGNNGKFIRSRLAAEKIRADFSRIKSETRANTTVINAETGEIRHRVRKGPRVTEKEFGNFVKKYALLLKNASAVVLSGSLPPGVSSSAYATLIRTAQKEGLATFLDTSGAPFRLALRAKPFLVKPNLEEAEQLLGKKLRATAAVKKALEKLLHSGVRVAIITLGKRGAAATEGKETIHAIPPKLRAQNTVGSGDAFLAGFLRSFLCRKSFRDCLKAAVATGSANALGIFPGEISIRTAEKISKAVRIKKF